MSKRYAPDAARQRTRDLGKGLLSLVGICLAALLFLRPPRTAAYLAAVSLTPTPSPAWTPTVELRDPHYDPPAPSDLHLSAMPPQVEAIDIDGYPRIVKLWGGYDPAVGLDFYANYDMIISEGFSIEQLAYLQSMNPRMFILYSAIGTYDLDSGPLGSQWIDAIPGMPEFECFYRGTQDQVLRVEFWNHGMFNMGNAWCQDAIVDYLASQFDPQVFAGVFFDRITQVITPAILDGVDLDHDGTVDGRATVNESHWRGTEQFLAKVRARLGNGLLIVANDAPLVYTSLLNGREYESFIRGILDSHQSWTGFRYNYEQWMLSSRQPRLTMVMGNPPTWMEKKYGYRPYTKMQAAVVEEASAFYQRMRFGLTTALLEGGLYSFEFGTTWHGNAWWYDEFDAGGLGKGFLGTPLGEARYALGPLTTANSVQNPGFEDPALFPWTLGATGVGAILSAVPISAPFATTLSARITITTADRYGVSGLPYAVNLQQPGIPLTADQGYTLALWGKASSPIIAHVALVNGEDPSIRYGLDTTLELRPSWQQQWATFTATQRVDNAVLLLGFDSAPGTVWIDEVKLQSGILPIVFRRDFEHGIVLCNATPDQQSIPLGKPYRKIDGVQAPRAKIIIDDTDPPTEHFIKVGGWAGHSAGYDDWGYTYIHALTTQDPSAPSTYVRWQPDIPTADWYTISAWVAPHDQLNGPIRYAIRHVMGTSTVEVNPVVSEPTWLRLGTFYLVPGSQNSVTMSNLTPSRWVIADAVKFESETHFNDGSLVSRITLDGMDGIILLNETFDETYLPLIWR
jgi:hypothetical protein